MNKEWRSLPTENLYRALGALKDEPQPDPWMEIQELAKVDPACRQAVDAVRFGRMSVQDAALALALCQTKRAMMVHDEAAKLLRLMPMMPLEIRKDAETKPEGL